MSAALDRRLEALEARQSEKEPWTIIRIMFMGGPAEEQDNEPFTATMGGRSIQRADDESAEAFLARVRVEARLAAKPGCTAVALVWPRPESPPGDLK